VNRQAQIGVAALAIVLVALGALISVGPIKLVLPGNREVTPPPQPTAGSEALPAAVGGNQAPTASPSTAVASPATVPSFDVVRIEPDGSAVIAGRATAGAGVTVLDGDRAVGTVTANDLGEWVLLLPPGTLPPGSHELSLRALQPDGQTLNGTATVTLVVPQPKQDIAGRPQGETGQALALLNSSKGASRVLQGPVDSNVTAGRVVIDTLDYDHEGRLAIGGRAAAGTSLQVYLDNALLGQTVADAQNRWEMAPDRLLPPGRYTIRVDAVSGDGRVTARAEVTFERRPLDGSEEGQRVAVILPGNNLWTISRRTYGAGIRYTLIFSANQDQIRDPNLIYPGQIFILPRDGSRR
jgi:nucleoid-associated protein YgaU